MSFGFINIGVSHCTNIYSFHSKILLSGFPKYLQLNIHHIMVIKADIHSRHVKNWHVKIDNYIQRENKTKRVNLALCVHVGSYLIFIVNRIDAKSM